MNKCSKKTQNCLIANNFEIHINKFQIKYKMFYNQMLTTAATATTMMSSQTGCANNPLIDSSHQAIATLLAREHTHTPCMTYQALSLLSYRCEQKNAHWHNFCLVSLRFVYLILCYFRIFHTYPVADATHKIITPFTPLLLLFLLAVNLFYVFQTVSLSFIQTCCV